MVDTFLVLPSVDSRDSELIFIVPISKALVFRFIIWATSTAVPMLKPLALIVMEGIADN